MLKGTAATIKRGKDSLFRGIISRCFGENKKRGLKLRRSFKKLEQNRKDFIKKNNIKLKNKYEKKKDKDEVYQPKKN